MSKAVLISIQPKWCGLIASGKKTLEVRKSRPKLETPFKCYIYCTKDKEILTVSRYSDKSVFLWDKSDVDRYNSDMVRNGKVIGEFICDDITKFAVDPKYDNLTLISMAIRSCLSKSQLEDYCSDYWLYGWHISDLKIYDKPKELSEFRAICRHYDDGLCGDCEYYDYANNESYRYEECAVDGLKPITRPPQSWCYVEECE